MMNAGEGADLSVRDRVGNEPHLGGYYEVIGAESASEPHPILFIHGGGATGAAFMQTPDGRPGWARLLARRGHECWVTDWPGTGRSGGTKDPLSFVYDDIVSGYERLLEDVIGRPTIILCHSMGGPATWALVERQRHLIAGVVSVGASGPANIPTPGPEILEDDGRVVRVRFGITGVEFTIDRQVPYLYEDAYVFEQGIADSERFDPGMLPEFRAGLVGIAPKVVLQKIGVYEGFPRISEPERFAGLPVRAVAGDRDPAHTRAIEERTMDLLREWGADASLVWLPDVGIEGNGHFLYAESNSDEVLEVVSRAIGLVTRLATGRSEP